MSATSGTGDDFARAEEALRLDRALREPTLRQAAGLLEQGRPSAAAQLLQIFLNEHPDTPDALNLMADAATREGRHHQAEALLARSLEIAPDSDSARFHYAGALFRAGKLPAARPALEQLLEKDRRNPLLRRQLAALLEDIGDYEQCAALFRELTDQYPAHAQLWLHYGHALRGLGSSGDSIAAYRKSLEIDASNGQAWWGLANLKTYRFSDADVAQMEAQLAGRTLTHQSRAAMNFALGKARADRQQYAKSFEAYAKGNAIQRLEMTYDADVLADYVTRCKTLFTPEFFASRDGVGSERNDPIFLVGMTRSGSTLVEQILAGHSAVEGTRELAELAAVARYVETEIAQRHRSRFPDVLVELGGGEFQALGERYLGSVQPYRSQQRPFFTDKMGLNFLYVGMLQLILPKARIVDMRRHPMACCWSNFTQLFAGSHNHAYRLTELGRLYRDYVELMAHWDRVLPGKVHRIFYERLVDDAEGEIRRLLNYLDLPFEAACLDFHKTRRAVSTASSEQVRNPVYRDALEHWRGYEPWLGSLKTALGPVLDAYPEAPDFT